MSDRHQARRPYIWSRAYSHDQFQKVGNVARMRRALNPDIAAATKFARCQIIDPQGWYNVGHSFDGIWEGEPVYFDPVIRPLFMEYAACLYELAAQEALERFPGFTDFTVEDGPDLGERRLVFTSTKHDLALPFMFHRMYSLAEEKAAAVAESIRVELDDSVRIGGRRKMKLFVSLDRSTTDKGTWEEVRACFAEGKPFPIDTIPRQCDIKLVARMRTSLSIPELVYMNWADVKKPLSVADQALLDAVRTFDPEELARCIAAGADPNAMDSSGDTALIDLIQSEPWHYVKPEPGVDWEDQVAGIPSIPLEQRKACIQVLLDAGAHIDLHGPDATSPLAMAVLRKDEDLLEWLLMLGADDTIQYDDSYPAEWPTAWDWAAGDCSCADVGEERDAAERTWRMLRKHRQAPDGTMPGERPEW